MLHNISKSEEVYATLIYPLMQNYLKRFFTFFTCYSLWKWNRMCTKEYARSNKETTQRRSKSWFNKASKNGLSTKHDKCDEREHWSFHLFINTTFHILLFIDLFTRLIIHIHHSTTASSSACGVHFRNGNQNIRNGKRSFKLRCFGAEAERVCFISLLFHFIITNFIIFFNVKLEKKKRAGGKNLDYSFYFVNS